MRWFQKYWSLVTIAVICVSLVILVKLIVKSADETAKEAALNAKCYWNPVGCLPLCIQESFCRFHGIRT